MKVTVSLTVELPTSGGVDEVKGLVLDAGLGAMREVLAQACGEYEREVAACDCPGCGGPESLRPRGTRRRVVVATFGRIVLQLWQLRCEGCGHKFTPGATFLEGFGGANITRTLREESAETGSSGLRTRLRRGASRGRAGRGWTRRRCEVTPSERAPRRPSARRWRHRLRTCPQWSRCAPSPRS
ncbi:MAG: hypothetical protein M3Q29_04315 [Chloroflexota bacterium]|nr:hypothetical protein [Chloroflexota bacterium]